MKTTEILITQQLTKLCANYNRPITSELVSLFCEEFLGLDESIFRKSVKWWITHNDLRMATVSQLKKKYFDVRREEQAKAENLQHGDKPPCQFSRFPKHPDWVECEIAKQLCCSTDDRYRVLNSHVCEFHYVLMQEWSNINPARIAWTGEYGKNWTHAAILKFRYERGDVVEKTRVMEMLSDEQKKIIVHCEHLTWKVREGQKIEAEDMFQALPYNPGHNVALDGLRD